MEPVIIVILLGIVFIPLLWFIGNYNGIVRVRNHVKEAFADIDTELKRRHNLIPNLVETVKGYAKHEEAVLKAVIEARARADRDHDSPKELASDENDLLSKLGGLFAVAEDYPELKADKHFLELQRQLVETENRIQAARRFYNGNVRELNNRVEMFPSSIVAGMMSVPKADYFEIDPLDRAVPQVSIRA